MNEIRRWELRGIGHAGPRLMGGAVLHEGAEGTVVTGIWRQDELVEPTRLLMAPGFELLSIRRLDTCP